MTRVLYSGDLRKALYGLRTAPRAWQDRLAELLHTHHFQHMQSEANVYDSLALKVIILVYADGLMVAGDRSAINSLMATLTQSLLLKRTGDLTIDGVGAEFVGRTCTRQGDADSNKYLQGILDSYGLATCKPAATTGTGAQSSKTATV